MGVWDGFFSFYAEERGAVVTATDDENYSWGKFGTGKAGFDFARKTRKSKVNEYISSAGNLCADDVGTFDIVFFFGVLYHIKCPYRSLETARGLTRSMAIILHQMRLV